MTIKIMADDFRIDNLMVAHGFIVTGDPKLDAERLTELICDEGPIVRDGITDETIRRRIAFALKCYKGMKK